MAKLLVLDLAEGGRVPFLRGILTRSLQDRGVDFDQAYALASTVRDELAGTTEITTDDLRARVASHLEHHDPELARQYRHPLASGATFLLRCEEGATVPFSRARHRASLECAGLGHGDSDAITSRLYQDLKRRGITEIGVRELEEETLSLVGRELGPDAARRFAAWEAFRRSGRPLVVLLGGMTGSGKSTVATRVASLANLVRVQSTDMLREVMRVMTPEHLLPVLHRHSYDAWKALPGYSDAEPEDALVADGYLTQAELVGVACEAALQRSVEERASMVLEGVHVHPGMLQRVEGAEDAVVVAFMLAVLKPKELRRRLAGRADLVPGRQAKKYLQEFDSIWRLQSFLLSEADHADMQIISNENLETTVDLVMRRISDVMIEEFPAD